MIVAKIMIKTIIVIYIEISYLKQLLTGLRFCYYLRQQTGSLQVRH